MAGLDGWRDGRRDGGIEGGDGGERKDGGMEEWQGWRDGREDGEGVERAGGTEGGEGVMKVELEVEDEKLVQYIQKE